MTKKVAYGYSYLIAFLYVGLGTLATLSVFPDNLFYGGWVIWAVLVTLPVNAFSLGVLYGGVPNQYLIVACVQSVMFLLTGWLLFRLVFKRYC